MALIQGESHDQWVILFEEQVQPGVQRPAETLKIAREVDAFHCVILGGGGGGAAATFLLNVFPVLFMSNKNNKSGKTHSNDHQLKQAALTYITNYQRATTYQS